MMFSPAKNDLSAAEEKSSGKRLMITFRDALRPDPKHRLQENLLREKRLQRSHLRQNRLLTERHASTHKVQQAADKLAAAAVVAQNTLHTVPPARAQQLRNALRTEPKQKRILPLLPRTTVLAALPVHVRKDRHHVRANQARVVRSLLQAAPKNPHRLVQVALALHLKATVALLRIKQLTHHLHAVVHKVRNRRPRTPAAAAPATRKVHTLVRTPLHLQVTPTRHHPRHHADLLLLVVQKLGAVPPVTAARVLRTALAAHTVPKVKHNPHVVVPAKVLGQQEPTKRLLQNAMKPIHSLITQPRRSSLLHHKAAFFFRKQKKSIRDINRWKSP